MVDFLKPSRQFLFLQGLPGDFFARLADELTGAGCGVHRVNFNGGDLIDWRLPDAINYRGAARNWPATLAGIISKRGITDIVLFGDCRPLHRMARATASGLGVTIHVFEEGYIRPDWVTLERGGVNGYSPLPANPEWYRQAAADLPPAPTKELLASSLKARARATVRYHLAAVMLAWGFPFYRTHRPWPVVVEAMGWLARLSRAFAARPAQGVPEGGYFLLPLQLDSDYQLRAHSDFDGMQPALAEILASFARSAPGHVRIAVKPHPLDNGLINWRRLVTAYAQALDVAERVLFVECDDILALVRGASGVVTVNSTTGTLALGAGKPVMAVGRAIYDMPGLTHQGPLDSFWSDPEAPDPTLYDCFQRVLIARCLLRGSFYRDEPERPLAIAAAERMARPVEVSAQPRRARSPLMTHMRAAV